MLNLFRLKPVSNREMSQWFGDQPVSSLAKLHPAVCFRGETPLTRRLCNPKEKRELEGYLALMLEYFWPLGKGTGTPRFFPNSTEDSIQTRQALKYHAALINRGTKSLSHRSQLQDGKMFFTI